MNLPLLNYVVLDGLAVDFANIEYFTFVQRLYLSEDLVHMCNLSVCLAKIIFGNLFYYSAYFCYYL